jgi:hypothetical protein
VELVRGRWTVFEITGVSVDYSLKARMGDIPWLEVTEVTEVTPLTFGGLGFSLRGPALGPKAMST